MDLAVALGPFLFINWSWAGVHAAYTDLVDDTYLQVVLNVNLTRQTNIRRELSFNRETIALEFSHLTGIAFKHFNTTRRATRIAPAPVQYVNTCIFQRKYEFFPGRWFGFNESSCGFSLDLWHL